MSLLDGWKIGDGEILISPDGERGDYSEYRRSTGLCETCGRRVSGHPGCDGCAIWSGDGHLATLSSYKKHQLCSSCIAAWKTLSKVVGRGVAWEQFLAPRLLYKTLLKQVMGVEDNVV